MDESSRAAVILPTEIREQFRPLRRKISHQSTPAFSTFLRSPSGSGGGGFLNSLMQRTMTHRQRAEIQLQSLLNEPEESLPTFVRRASDHLDSEKLSIEEVSKLLNTQPFIIERLVYALYSSTDDDDDIKTISDNASTANDVNVFFCGPSTIAQTIRNHCATFRFRFYEEKF